MTTREWPTIPLRRLAVCWDSVRIPLNAVERAERPGDVPYWGANSIQDYVDEALVREEVVLVGEDGAPFFDRNRPVAFRIDGPIWPNNHIHVLKPRSGVDAAWLAYALNDVDYSLYVAGTTRDKLTQGALMSIALLVPSLAEQRAISRLLDKEIARIDALIAEQEGLVEILRERRRAVIEQAVVNQNISHGARRQPPVSAFLVPLRRLLRSVESGVSVNSGSRPAMSGELAVLKTGVVLRGTFAVEENKVVDEPEEISRLSCPVRGESLIVSRMNTPSLVGAAAYVPLAHDWLFLPDRLWQVTFNDRASAKFVDYWTKTRHYREQVESACVGTSSSMQNISRGDFASLTIPLPERLEQDLVVAYLDEQTQKTDALIAEAEGIVAVAKERRSALISAAVTGQIDVRGEVA